MPNVYDGPIDARQADTAIEVTRFRPRYRALTEAEVDLHDKIKGTADHLEQLFQLANKNGRYGALAITSLEQAVMWAVKDLTS